MEDMVQNMLWFGFEWLPEKGRSGAASLIVRNLKKSNHAKFGTLTSSICNEFL
jgi:hypothetical protein